MVSAHFYYSANATASGAGLRWVGRSMFLAALALLALPCAASVHDYIYTSSGGKVTITSYTGSGGAVTVPDTIEGKPVTRIGDLAFSYNTSLSSITIPDGVESIGIYAFTGCTSLRTATIGNGVTSMDNYVFTGCVSLSSVTIGGGIISIGNLAFNDCAILTSVYFEGNAPGIGSLPFQGANNVTVFYLPAATGWGATFGERTTMVWDPQIVLNDDPFSGDDGAFAFIVTADIDLTVAIQVSDILGESEWLTLITVTLNAGSFDFNDPDWESFESSFYRLRMPRGE